MLIICKIKKLNRQYYKSVTIGLDLLFTTAVWCFFFFLRKVLLNESFGVDYLTLVKGSIFVTSVWMFLYTVSGGYVKVFRKSRVKSIITLFLVSLLGSVIVFMTLMLDDEVSHPKLYYKLFLVYFSLHFGVLATQKVVVLSYFKRLIAKGEIQFNTLIVGGGDGATKIYDSLVKINKSLGYRFIGYVNALASSNNAMSEKLRCFGDLNQLATIIRRGKIEQVIIAVESSENEKIAQILTILEDYDLTVSIKPDLYHMLIGTVKVNHLMGVPLIEVNQELMPIWQFVIKRLFDISASLIFFLIGAPLLVFVALMTKLSSSGPIFFKQVRIGKFQKPFYIYKFRSMFVNSEAKGPALSSDFDPRITKWGRIMRKTRLDELPQFWNVLKGDMAIVGPRPERNHFIKLIEEKAPYYRRILKVRPGITSLGQVKYGYAENVEEMVDRLEFDIIYIENISLVMDLRILFMTVLIIIQGRGK